MKTVSIVRAFTLAALLSACTTADIYEELGDNARERCQRMPETDRAGCMQRSQGDYDAYKKRREELKR